MFRTDILDWLLYCCLKPDRNISLISYPYYVKYVTGDNATFSRHIDLNVRHYLEDDHGDNIIQESVLLNDEVAEDVMTLKNHPDQNGKLTLNQLIADFSIPRSTKIMSSNLCDY